MKEHIDPALERVQSQYVMTEQDRLVVFLSASYVARDLLEGEPQDRVHTKPLLLNFTHNGGNFQADVLPNARWIMWELSQRARENLLKIGRDDIVDRAERYVFDKFGKPKEIESGERT